MSTITFPAPDLSAQIDFCWSVTGDAAGGAAFHELLPDSGVHLVVRLVFPRKDRPARSRHREGFRRARPRLPVLRHPLPHRAGSASRGRPRFGADQRLRRALPPWRESGGLRGGPAPVLAGRRVAPAAHRGSVEARKRRWWAIAGAGSPRRLPRDARRKPQRRRARPRAGFPRPVAGADVPQGSASRRSGSSGSMRLRRVLGALHAGRFGTLAELAHATATRTSRTRSRDFKQLTGRAPGEKDAFRARPLAESAWTRIVHGRR